MRRFRSRTTIITLVAAGAVGGILLVLTLLKSPVIFGLREDIARAIPTQAVPAGVGGLSAEACGACHREIYDEWKTSIHSQAFVDPFFQAYWRKDKHIWVCLNCHTPLQNQQAEVVAWSPGVRVDRAEKRPNPDFDAALQHEGITCAACHVRDGVIEGPYDDSVAPHPTRYAERFRTTEICYTCHAVPSDRLQFYNGGPCATFMEYEAGPYKAKGYICQNCHMPEVERVMAEGGPVRKGRRHLWRGGHDPEQLNRALTAALTADEPTLTAGRRTTWTLTMTNSGAGHMLPTGDPDRYLLAELEVRDKTGRVVSSQRDTIRRWLIWWPVIYEYRDTRIAPLASRDLTLAYDVPADDEGVTLTARVSYRFMTDRQYQRLKTKYGMQVDKTYVIPLYEQTLPLRSGETMPQVAQATTPPSCAAPESEDNSSGEAS
jgi:hypothetical protein